MYLNCHTYFSFKYGTLSPVELWEEAHRCNVKKLVVTEINNTSSYIELHRICQERKHLHALEIVPGIEFRCRDQLLFIGIPLNNTGFEELCRYLSYQNATGLPPLKRAPEFGHCLIIYPRGSISSDELRDYEFIGIRPQEVPHIFHSRHHYYLHKLVALHPVTFKNRTGYNAHRLLRSIDQNTLLSKLNEKLQAHSGEMMMPENDLLSFFWQYPQIVTNTRKLLAKCSIDIDLETPKNKQKFFSSKKKDREILQSLALEGFGRRYGNLPNPEYARQRLLRELEVIAERQFETYFLISSDIVKFAQHKNFAYVGRGSGANSMVAYCLGITEVDPVELDLYFERFLNPHRTTPPDFDIDFSWKDRDHVIDYIFEKYTTDHAALLATYTTFQERSVLRELGKVFGLPKNEIDKIADRPAENNKQDEITRLMFKYARQLKDFPQNLSIHAGGIVISEKPIYAYTATELPPKGYPITQFDMYGAEDIGLYKFDVLSQRGLGHIKDTVTLIERNKGIKIDISQTSQFKQDPRCNDLLSEGHCMGCFYIESPAMRMLLAKLKCNNYITLVAASSIIRPGVARSGMMREYISRHHNLSNIKYIHPKMGELMKETYGVMVYQEDVIKVAHHFAGLDLAEADILRRGMSGKYRSREEFKRVERKFFQNCSQRGYSETVTNEVWRQIESFSGYSFSKAHSASYAVESYQSLYLKASYPLEFMVGVINNFGGFYSTEFYFHEARMQGAKVQPPCVNNSDYLTNIYGEEIFVGFIHLKSLEQKIGEQIPKERIEQGPFKSLENFVERISLGLEQLFILIKIGAFRFTGIPKRALMWEAKMLFGRDKQVRHTRNMFGASLKKYGLPVLDKKDSEDAFDELELLGFPLCDPFSILRTPENGGVLAADLVEMHGKAISITGYFVTSKNTYTKDHQLMHFGTFLDQKGKMFDTTHFPAIAKSYPFRGKGFYKLSGKVTEDFGYPMLEVNKMEKLSMVNESEKEYLGQQTDKVGGPPILS